jgi:hypothetical protein
MTLDVLKWAMREAVSSFRRHHAHCTCDSHSRLAYRPRAAPDADRLSPGEETPARDNASAAAPSA